MRFGLKRAKIEARTDFINSFDAGKFKSATIKLLDSELWNYFFFNSDISFIFVDNENF